MRCLGLFCSLLVLSSPALGQGQFEPAIFPGGHAVVGLTHGDKAVLESNRLRRGDNPFDQLYLQLFADIAFPGSFSLFNQMLIDPNTRADLSSFLRSYLRYTALYREGAELHLQAGKLPTPFGNIGQRVYPDTNPLVGLPLMYQYFTSLRANQLPSGPADLLAHRGEGRGALFTGFAGGGAPFNFSGLPMIYDGCWDFGVEALGSLWRLEYLAALTQGTLSDPRSTPGDNNDGRQLALRLGFVPATGWLVGASLARGPYLDRAVEPFLAGDQKLEDFEQFIWGLYGEFSWRHLRLDAELAFNTWEVPTLDEDLQTAGWYLEAKYKLRPGLFAALRHSGIDFSAIDDGSGAKLDWDYDVQRWEAGLGYHLTEGVLAKAVWQSLDSAAPGHSREHFAALQTIASF